MFRDLIPRLAGDYRVIAPDLPGFGFTELPAETNYIYSFDRLALTIEAFTQALNINRYAIYVFDCLDAGRRVSPGARTEGAARSGKDRGIRATADFSSVHSGASADAALEIKAVVVFGR
jgi:hypothetical protein